MIAVREGQRRRRIERDVATGILVSLFGLCGCTVGPDYERPDARVPVAYKEAWKPGPTATGWRETRPADGTDRGAWWSIYRDPVLDGLERQIDISNQNLKAAEAAFREAEATVAAARAQFFPTAKLAGSATRTRSSGNSAPTAGFGGGISDQFLAETTASWVPDLWGSVRRTVESDVASAQASAATLANARLSAQGTLATAYLELRTADELARLLEASVKAYTQALQITRNQYRSGTTDASAVAQAQAQLDATRSQLIAVGVTRGQLEHSIAVLIGKPPAELTITPTQATIAGGVLREWLLYTAIGSAILLAIPRVLAPHESSRPLYAIGAAAVLAGIGAVIEYGLRSGRERRAIAKEQAARKVDAPPPGS